MHQFNLGWKLALVHKGLAKRSLLESYDEERRPVAKAVIDTTNAFAQASFFKSQLRVAAPDIFRQLGVNYRWSSIVVDEQGASSTGEEMAAYLPSDSVELRAGDRAPDAPGLKLFSRDVKTLFSIFKPTRHTLLLFDPVADGLQAVFSALPAIHKGVFHSVVILSSENTGDESSISKLKEADEVLVDTEGHAFAAYHPVKDGFRVFIVRPDGVLGAVVKGSAGVEKYLKAALFNQP